MALQRAAVARRLCLLRHLAGVPARLDRLPGIQAAVLHDGDVVLETAHGLADVDRRHRPDDRPPLPHRLPLQDVHRDRRRAPRRARRAAPRRHRRAVAARSRGGPPIARVTLRELLAHGGGLVRDGRDGDHWQLVRPFPDAATPARASPSTTAAVLRAQRALQVLQHRLLAARRGDRGGHRRALRRPRRGALLEPARADATTPDIDSGPRRR